ncbi:caspase family protein [Cupriavidus sp. TMH.W2]|uniref:caspase family protein n=1 Tax=Cupriavidus sp. TMH.W2 TaxID=3434465 RepID=UPI003D777DD1
MTAMLLCVGCDEYEYIDRLQGAERDAREMYAALTSGPSAVFAPTHSVLLPSPTLQELRNTLSHMQDGTVRATTLTVFFAGHGTLSYGSYYFCVRDTQVHKMSTSGFALTHLFEFVNESGVSHCNIIIDACNAGGMVADIGALLKPEIIGRSKSVGVSIFVSAASDQYAAEVATGGYGTSALIRVLKGDIDTGSRSSHLDLLDVGRAAAQTVISESAGEQSPSVWGMNLYGAAAICTNPHASEGAWSMLGTTGISPDSAAGQLIAECTPFIFRLMSGRAEDMSPRAIFQGLYQHVRDLAPIPGAAAQLVEGIHRSLLSSPGSREHSFLRAEITATCIAMLLRDVIRDADIAGLCGRLGMDLIEQVSTALDETAVALRQPGGICQSGIPDLFLLPQRISRILGWGAAALLIAEHLSVDTRELSERFIAVQQVLFDEYGANLCGMSERETPFWMTYLVWHRRNGTAEHGEQLLGMLWSGLLNCNGAFAHCSLKPAEAFKYLCLRARADGESDGELRANPSEMLALTMLLGSYFGLDDVFDPDMERLDHAHAFIFLPSDHTEFAEIVIREGRNHVFQVGHGVWTLSDLRDRWSTVCVPQLLGDASLMRMEVGIGALCAALIFPDRVPWFLLRLISE